MYITAREKLILDHLLERTEETTTLALSKELDVSQRTIHRDLKGVEAILKTTYNLGLKKTSGRGILVTGETTSRQALKMYLMNFEHTEYTPEERQDLIFCSLLEAQEPVKLFSLANDLHVTIATISNDLDKLELRLRELGLTLTKKRGYGVEVSGTEQAKRRAMSRLIMDQLSESEFLSVIRDTIQKKSSQMTDTISERLLGLVEKKKILLVEQVIEELPYSIADSAFIGLVVHLALAMERIIRGEKISIDEDFLTDLKKTKEFAFAQTIAQKLESVFEIDIPDAEIGFICMHLSGAKLRHDKESLLDEANYPLTYKARQLIQKVGEAYGQNLAKDPSLIQGLVAHLKPAMYRIKEQMRITNPVLSKIKQDYMDLFQIVKKAVAEVFEDLMVPDEEIGFIVMHFGAALVKSETTQNLNALIICSSGIGTSKMLASRLKRDLPEIQEARNASVLDLKDIDLSAYDLVFSTIPLPNFKEDYIFVSPIPTEAEIAAIRNKIRHVESRLGGPDKPKPKLASTQSAAQILKTFEKSRNYTDTIYNVLAGFSLTMVKEAGSIEGLLQMACHLLLEKDYLLEPEKVKTALLERERQGGLGIPSTEMALYHAKSPYIKKPSFTILELDHPVKVLGMNNDSMDLRHLLLMLSPDDLSEEGLEVLSFISTLIIENEESLALFQTEDETLILSHLSLELDVFYKDKTRS
jgi:mannitol operon transcriptional antiterminator